MTRLYRENIHQMIVIPCELSGLSVEVAQVTLAIVIVIAIAIAIPIEFSSSSILVSISEGPTEGLTRSNDSIGSRLKMESERTIRIERLRNAGKTVYSH
jgi:hypothetical protein